MTLARQPSPLRPWFDDFATSMQWLTPSRTITERDVLSFSAFDGRYAEHANAELSPAGLLAIATGLCWTRLGLNERRGIAFLGWADWEFLLNVSVGDTVRVSQTVQHLRASSTKRDRGIVTFKVVVLGQSQTVLQRGTWSLMWARDPAMPAPPPN